MNDNNRIAINSIVIFGRLIITSIFGLLTSRLVLDALGTSDYGLYNVVGGIVVLLNVLNTAMIATTYRFVAIELGKEDRGDINKVFNVCFIIHCVFAIFVVLAGVSIGLWYLNNGLNVDPVKLGDAKFLFMLSIITTVINVIMVPYNGLLVAFEKFNIQATIDIFVAISKYSVLFLFLYSFENRLKGYGFVNALFVITNASIAYFYCKKNYSRIISIKITKDCHLYKDMLSFAGWILLGAGASVGKTQGSVIVINYFFGTLINGAYAVAHQVENFISLFASSLNKAAVPQIMKSYSGGNENRAVKLTSYISKYTFILMCIASFPVIVEMDFLFGLWLKEIPKGTTLFCKLMIVSILLGSLGQGIPALIQATNKQKAFQIVGSTMLLLGLPISCLLFYQGYAAYYILVVYCILQFCYSLITLYLLKRILNFDVLLFVKTSYLRIALISIPLIVFYIYYDPVNYTTVGHVLGVILSELFLVWDIFVMGIDKNERKMLKSFIEKRWK